MIVRRVTLQLTNLRAVARSYGSDKSHGVSAAPDTPTGIEYQEAYNKRGKANPSNFEKDYKCIDYLKYNVWSFYDKENEMQQYRVQQPSHKKPDTEPKFKTQA